MGCLALFSVGCVMGEQVNEHKSEVASAGSGGSDSAIGSAETSPGGAAGAPDDETGGASPSASGGSAGAADDVADCASDEKLCDAGCVPVTPEVGCGSYSCTPCNTPPANSKPICDGALCEFECLPGFTRDGFACVSEQGGGGSGGSSGGSGGSGSSGASGSGAGSTGGAGGGTNLCAAPCNPSDPQAQFLCFAACAASGGVGLCAPALNCCVCG
jgi:hypothetical protein